MSKLILPIGLPGSGKSTWSRNYVGNDVFKDGYCLGSHDGNDCVIISSDEVRKANGWEPDETVQTFDLVNKMTQDFIKKDYTVIYDATNLRAKYRKELITRVHADEVEGYVIIEPWDVCLARNQSRAPEAIVPNYAMYRMWTSFDVPLKSEGFTKFSFNSSSEVRGLSLEELLKMTEGFDQDNPHHSQTLDEHLNQTVKYVKEHGGSEACIVAAQYHDIGKLYTKRYEDKNGDPSEFAHYYGHEHVSAYLYLVAHLRYDSNYGMPCIYPAQLINYHMRPHVWPEMKPRRLEFEKEFLGEQMVKDLELLHEADISCH